MIYLHGAWEMDIVRHDKFKRESVWLGFHYIEFGLFIVRVHVDNLDLFKEDDGVLFLHG